MSDDRDPLRFDTDAPDHQRFTGDALGWWNERIDSVREGQEWPDGSDSENVYTLSADDVSIIEAALKRQFVQVKKGRVQVLHAIRALVDR